MLLELQRLLVDGRPLRCMHQPRKKHVVLSDRFQAIFSCAMYRHFTGLPAAPHGQLAQRADDVAASNELDEVDLKRRCAVHCHDLHTPRAAPTASISVQRSGTRCELCCAAALM